VRLREATSFLRQAVFQFVFDRLGDCAGRDGASGTHIDAALAFRVQSGGHERHHQRLANRLAHSTFNGLR